MKRMILLYSLLAICVACGGTTENSEEQWESDSPAPSSTELREDVELVEPITPECGTVDTVCVSLQIPESVTETPEKLIIGLYESLPPMGPPDVTTIAVCSAVALGSLSTFSEPLPLSCCVEGALRCRRRHGSSST